jgi:general secretion pathway protein B
MSYILEALKRAEQERQIGQAPNAAAPAPEAYESDRRYWPWVLLMVLLLAVAVLAIAFWLSAGRSAAPEQAALAPQSQPQAVAKMPTKPQQADTQAAGLPTRVTAVRSEPALVIQAAPIEQTPIAEVQLPTGPAVVEPAQPEPKAEPEAVVPELALAAAQTPAEESVEPAAEQQTEAPAVAPVASASAAEARADELSSEGADSGPADYELPWLNEMPVAFRRGVPSLEIQFHRYTDDRSRSFVMIAGQRYREGQILKSGPTLERIVEEGLILRWRGERFIYPLGG